MVLIICTTQCSLSKRHKFSKLPCHVGNTRSHLNSEVRQHWETTWELLMHLELQLSLLLGSKRTETNLGSLLVVEKCQCLSQVWCLQAVQPTPVGTKKFSMLRIGFSSLAAPVWGMFTNKAAHFSHPSSISPLHLYQQLKKSWGQWGSNPWSWGQETTVDHVSHNLSPNTSKRLRQKNSDKRAISNVLRKLGRDNSFIVTQRFKNSPRGHGGMDSASANAALSPGFDSCDIQVLFLLSENGASHEKNCIIYSLQVE